MDMQDDLVKEFVVEAREHLADIETDLLTVEELGADIDEELVNKVFRAAHSIKGGSSFFGLNKIKELAHKAETVLDMIRSRKIVPNPETTNLLLAAFDQLRSMIDNISESENVDIWENVASLTQLASSYLPEAEKESLSRISSIQSEKTKQAVSIPAVDIERARRTGHFIYLIEYDLIHDIERLGKNVLQVFDELYASGEVIDCYPDFDAVGTLDEPISNSVPLRLVFATILEPDLIGSLFEVDKEKITLLLDPNTAEETPAVAEPSAGTKAAGPEAIKEQAPPEPVRAVEPETQPPPAPAPEKQAPARPRAAGRDHPETISLPGDTTLRVDVELLETLMNLAGELVLSRNQLRESLRLNDHRALAASSQRINLVTSELQDAIMQTRMQPIGNVFAKFPRLVRDMAHAMNKEIHLEMIGKDVELDKSLVEGLSDPLTHMVRNSADHGIETKDERIAAGKKPFGTIKLEARHEAGQVVVEISDDGKGLDSRKIAAKALEQGLVSQEKLQGMSEKDKMALIFMPGLSTAEKVTDVSGRGVGMDVVKTNLDQLGGTITINSEPGKGTLFSIKLPLTLAIIPSLIVVVQGERFAIPQINVVELLHIRAEQARNRIEVVGDAEVLLLRDQIVPILRFTDLMGIVPTYADGKTGSREICRRTRLADRRSPHHSFSKTGGINGDAAYSDGDREERRESDGRRYSACSDYEIAVVTTGTMQYGIVVDSFQKSEEIVVKPLGRHLKGLSEYAGATIMGDGRIALILDVNGLAAKANLAPVSGSARALELAEEAEKEKLKDTHSLLLFYNGPDELCAAPLATVMRVERITARRVETAGGRRTMQYRGASLPLVTLSDAANVQPIGEDRDLAVIVSNIRGREVGLLGAMPVDVIECQASIDVVTHRQPGILGSAVIRDKTVLMTDVHELVDAVYPDWGGTQEVQPEKKSEDDTITLLLAEDSDFFRSQVRRFLEEGGYSVLEAPDGQAAWEVLMENTERVRAVVTDIEMPRLSGLGLSQRIRSEPKTAALPIIGLTSLAGEEDITKGKEAGINDYQIKLDRERLLDGLKHVLAV